MFQYDRGGKYLSLEFNSHLKEGGILSQLIPVGTPYTSNMIHHEREIYKFHIIEQCDIFPMDQDEHMTSKRPLLALNLRSGLNP